MDYYESLLPGFRSTPEPKVQSSIFQKVVEAAKNKAEDWNIETLSDECDTSAENNSSVVLAVKASDSEWWLLTGDAGEPALNGVLDYLDLKRLFGLELQVPPDSAPRKPSQRGADTAQSPAWPKAQ